MGYKIAIDIGTTSLKAVLFDEELDYVYRISKSYPTIYPMAGRAEQKPDDIYQAFEEAVQTIRQQYSDIKIDEIAFSSAMHSIIAVNEKGDPITNCLLWSDNRAAILIDDFKREQDWLSYYKKTGTPVHPMSPFAKLLWMKAETNLIEEAYKFIGIKEYIFWKLTGQYVVDFSIASATGLFNIHELDWDKEILATTSVRPDQLSRTVDVTSRFDIKDQVTYDKLNLNQDTQLVIGASDGCLANLGTGASEKGQTTLTIGTSGALRMTVDEPLLDEEGRTFCYYLTQGKWVVGGAVNNGGNVIQWLDHILFDGEGHLFSQLPEVMQTTIPGSNGLFFFPYLNGERAPFWDGNMQGSYYGLGIYHQKNDMIRASIEGVLFNLNQVLHLIEEIAGQTAIVLASGGFLKSSQWAQLAADVFGKTLVIPHEAESSCLGAVMLTATSEKKTNHGNHIYPQIDSAASYRALFDTYKWYSEKLYDLHLVAQKESMLK